MNVVSKKLGGSFEADEDPNYQLKFWSYVKATSDDTCIPRIIHLHDVFKIDPADQAQLFNSFSQQQFAEPSWYDILVEYGLNDEWHIIR